VLYVDAIAIKASAKSNDWSIQKATKKNITIQVFKEIAGAQSFQEKVIFVWR
jgi:hypothetical protein